MKQPPVGIVLAGGHSRRLGFDKALVRYRGETLVDRAVRRLHSCCAEVAVADRGLGLAEAGRSLGDGPGSGPAAGILGAAAHYPDRDLVVLACDLPLVPTPLLRWLATHDGGDWVVPRHAEGLEPLCACYRPPALAALETRVAAGDFALHRLRQDPSLTIVLLEGARLEAFGNRADWLLNLNRATDLQRLAAREPER